MSNSLHSLLRRREGIASVSFSELLFDLICVFAVTQISHYLLHHLTWLGFVQSTIIWFAVWLAWQHTTWMTNWFDPNIRGVRIILFVLMIIGLILSAAIPEAFGERGMIFALCYVVIQIGRSVSILFMLGRKHHLTLNYTRILGWSIITSIFWIAGALQEDYMRVILWGIAVMCDLYGTYARVLPACCRTFRFKQGLDNRRTSPH